MFIVGEYSYPRAALAKRPFVLIRRPNHYFSVSFFSFLVDEINTSLLIQTGYNLSLNFKFIYVHVYLFYCKANIHLVLIISTSVNSTHQVITKTACNLPSTWLPLKLTINKVLHRTLSWLSKTIGI